jgi:dolichol-phosphate mannosyltransferase
LQPCCLEICGCEGGQRIKAILKQNELADVIRNHWQNMLKFASVGASGAIINLFFIWLLTEHVHLFYILSALIAIEISILWNFIWNTKLTFGYKFENMSDLLRSLIAYHIASLLGLSVNLLTLFALTEFIKIYYIISEFIGILLAFGFNYALSITYVWRKKI